MIITLFYYPDWVKIETNCELLELKITTISAKEKVYFKSQILVHKYWPILDHFFVPVL